MATKEYVNELMEQGRNSSHMILSQNLKDPFLFPFLPTIVIDNFYEDAEVIRDYALDQEYYKGNRGSWPGLRSDYIQNLDMGLWHTLYKKLMLELKPYGFQKFDELQSSFQLINESYGKGWVHDDDPHFTVAGLVYLNPDAPIGSGTTLYDGQTDFNGDRYGEIFMNDVLLSTDQERTQYTKYRDEQRAHFTATTTIESVFNRCIIFDPRTWHGADNFFGVEKSETRLTQVFFARAV
jgi:hypothetical protein